MPRLGLSLNDAFDNRARAPKPDQYGRRVRTLDGVKTVDAEKNPIFASLYVKIVLALTLFATLAMSLAILRLLTFRH